MEDTFVIELARLINKYSLESGSDTPDFILAEYLERQLKLYNDITHAKSMWQ